MQRNKSMFRDDISSARIQILRPEYFLELVMQESKVKEELETVHILRSYMED